MSGSEVEPEAVFSEDQWQEIARSIPLDELPRDMKQEICDALCKYEMFLIADQNGDDVSKEPRRQFARDAKRRDALVQLMKCAADARELRLTLYRIDRDLRPRRLIDEAERLAEQAYVVGKAAQSELEERLASRGGRPTEADRDDLILRLIDAYWRFTKKKPGVSKSRDPHNPDRFKLGGPCYRYLSTILTLSGISPKGIEHVIAKAAKDPKYRI